MRGEHGCMRSLSALGIVGDALYNTGISSAYLISEVRKHRSSRYGVACKLECGVGVDVEDKMGADKRSKRHFASSRCSHLYHVHSRLPRRFFRRQTVLGGLFHVFREF